MRGPFQIQKCSQPLQPKRQSPGFSRRHLQSRLEELWQIVLARSRHGQKIEIFAPAADQMLRLVLPQVFCPLALFSELYSWSDSKTDVIFQRSDYRGQN